MSAVTVSEHRRTCLVFSPGGHKAELLRALAGIRFTDAYSVTFDDGRADTHARDPNAARCHLICHPRRSIGRTIVNALQSIAILLRERPRLIISSGADVSLATLVFGRLFGAEVIFIETGGTIEPSLTGRLVYPFANLFIVQWPEKLERFPRAILADGLLL